MKLSIFIQTFQRPHMLKDCLNFLQTNLLENLKKIEYETLIGDDGSKDKETPVLIKNFNPTFLVINPDKKRFGPGYIMNQCYKKMTGDMVLHIEDDCWLTKAELTEDILLAMYDCLTKYPKMKLIKLDTAFQGKPTKERYTNGPYEFSLYSGTMYNYTNRPHVCLPKMWREVGAYPENMSIWKLENTYAHKFNSKRFRSGRLITINEEERKGFFRNQGGDSTLKVPGVFK